MAEDSRIFRATTGFLIAGAVLLAHAGPVAAEEQSKSVIGPSNQALYDGAQALLAGDGEEGIRLTLKGLEFATSDRDRVSGLANLCAGYVLLEQYNEALVYCDRVLEANDRHWRTYSNRALAYIGLGRFEDARRDVDSGQAISPNNLKLKRVRAMLLDATEPVTPRIEIDDRRQPPKGGRDD